VTARGVVAAIVATVILCCTGCASLWSDVKSEAKACEPAAEANALLALPYMAALASCEAKHGDCSSIVAGLKGLGLSDLPGAQQCAAVKLHNAIVDLANGSIDAGTAQ
jgi:hypothetical protein